MICCSFFLENSILSLGWLFALDFNVKDCLTLSLPCYLLCGLESRQPLTALELDLKVSRRPFKVWEGIIHKLQDGLPVNALLDSDTKKYAL